MANKIKDKKGNKILKNNRRNINKHIYGRKEFTFNLLSLIFLIGLGVYFGYRSLYYYSKQNIVDKKEVQTLNGVILKNYDVVKDGSDGFHHDTDGYYFKGNVDNNYVSFGNRLFRIIRINNNNTVKVISEDLNATFMYGDDTDYEKSNVKSWLTKTDAEHSGIFYQTIPSVDDFLVKTKFSIDSLKNGKIASSNKNISDYITILSIHDYTLANGKNSFLNTGKMFYLLGYNDDGSILYVDEDGSIQSCDSLDGYGIRAVMTLKKDLAILSGDGTLNNPYVIDQGDKVNYVGKYVKLGNDIWKVYYDDNSALRLGSGFFINVNGNEVLKKYGSINSYFDLSDKKGLAYYLNNEYYNSLPYKDLLLDTEFYVGEISDDSGYNFNNIFNDKVTCKIGILNVFDNNVNIYYNDVFSVNRTSSIGSMVYLTGNNGFLGEANILDEKHIAPVISIEKSVLKSGDGSIDNPYIVG